MQASD